MRIVVALGGNALQRRGEPMTVAGQRHNIAVACKSLAPVAQEHELVITHGNGPQVGLLALQAAAYDEVSAYPFDVLGAQTDGMIGYLVEQELGNLVPPDKPLATVVTMVVVDAEDPAFAAPTKFVGPGYPAETADELGARRGWVFRQDGAAWRRVVPSPKPQRIVEIRPIEWLLAQGCVVIAAGGGGIPTAYVGGGSTLTGIEAVIDKDRASAVLAQELAADLLVIATDVDAVYLDWGTPGQRAVSRVHPDALDPGLFPAGSMGPKVEAAAQFARATGRPAAIGSLDQLTSMLDGDGGTRISVQTEGMEIR
ncbi:carbamate kinase [Blastococcus sp. URHD0036]|uniref:carbamate kinase n=1 Tax=Blastococcus sp. URHD0036 TaxID=1380356 RepID=UPI000497E7EB|nr:carbamate kinase [Blastococcus sp. URHD0036]